MRRDLEALLFAADQPLTIERLASIFTDVGKPAIREAIQELREEYDRDQHAFTIVEFGGGFSISTRPEHAKLVRKLFRGRRKQRLSRASLEVLAIIAYKQPVTRLEIEEIRGVSVQGVLGTLLERDLVQIVGRAESLGHPLLYGSTKTFLDYLGLRRIQDLPQLSELEDLLAQKEELKQLAAHYGEQVTDDELEAARDRDDDEAEIEAESEAEAEDGSPDEGGTGESIEVGAETEEVEPPPPDDETSASPDEPPREAEASHGAPHQ